MAYNQELADAVHVLLRNRKGFTEKKMFGGIAFLQHGNMCVGIVGQELMVRVGTENYQKALSRQHVRPMDFTGRPLTGFVYVAPAGWRRRTSLAGWIEKGIEFTSTLRKKKR